MNGKLEIQPSIPFHSLVRLVDVEEYTIEKSGTSDLPLEIDNDLTSKL